MLALRLRVRVCLWIFDIALAHGGFNAAHDCVADRSLKSADRLASHAFAVFRAVMASLASCCNARVFAFASTAAALDLRLILTWVLDRDLVGTLCFFFLRILSVLLDDEGQRLGFLRRLLAHALKKSLSLLGFILKHFGIERIVVVGQRYRDVIHKLLSLDYNVLYIINVELVVLVIEKDFVLDLKQNFKVLAKRA